MWLTEEEEKLVYEILAALKDKTISEKHANVIPQIATDLSSKLGAKHKFAAFHISKLVSGEERLTVKAEVLEGEALFAALHQNLSQVARLGRAICTVEKTTGKKDESTLDKETTQERKRDQFKDMEKKLEEFENLKKRIRLSIFQEEESTSSTTHEPDIPSSAAACLALSFNPDGDKTPSTSANAEANTTPTTAAPHRTPDVFADEQHH